MIMIIISCSIIAVLGSLLIWRMRIVHKDRKEKKKQLEQRLENLIQTNHK
ncbi:hypothetical protein LYSBPC_36480 [Lysinibacillus piscis]|uniref:DUF4083 domain-containing protein n=1 Tax=Lysinibacillus piscis TaxID=2518931 RepID=A0ABQ5NQ87_9BACI|nr:hypothetical protein LYSBPC_36480 [Lysinibacillus sp. KH24]